jgi:Integrase zinc binding domain
VNRMYKKIRLKYNWNNLKSDVKKFVKSCSLCQRNKSVNKKVKAPLEITDTPESAFEKIYLDIVGPLPISQNGNRFILTCQDSLTKFLEAIPIPNMTAETISLKLVTDIICRHGIMNSIVTDQGSNFISELFTNCCKLLKIKKLHCTTYHPESNSIERNHRTIAEYLRSFVNKTQTDWCEWLPFVVFSYNTTPHTSTKYTPYELVYGRQAVLPTAIIQPPTFAYTYDNFLDDLKLKLQVTRQDARDNLIARKENSKERYDKDSTNISYRVGDKVLLSDDTLKNNRSKKLNARYTGPYTIISVDSNVNCTIKCGKKLLKVHKNRLKLFTE